MRNELSPRPDSSSSTLGDLWLATRDVQVPLELIPFNPRVTRLSPHVIKEAYSEHPEILPFVFTQEELAYCLRQKARTEERIAAEFLAKQTTASVLGLPVETVNWQDIQIEHSQFGAPSVRLNGKAQEVASEMRIEQVFISLSHEPNNAIAFCVPHRAIVEQKVVGVGADLCERNEFTEGFIRGMFTEEEIASCQKEENPGESLAMHFAAKEAVIKILQIWAWKGIQVVKDEEGKYILHFDKRVMKRAEDMGVSDFAISLSFDRQVGAVALMVATSG